MNKSQICISIFTIVVGCVGLGYFISKFIRKIKKKHLESNVGFSQALVKFIGGSCMTIAGAGILLGTLDHTVLTWVSIISNFVTDYCDKEDGSFYDGILADLRTKANSSVKDVDKQALYLQQINLWLEYQRQFAKKGKIPIAHKFFAFKVHWDNCTEALGVRHAVIGGLLVGFVVLGLLGAGAYAGVSLVHAVKSDFKECIHMANCPEFPGQNQYDKLCHKKCSGQQCIHFCGCDPSTWKEKKDRIEAYEKGKSPEVKHSHGVNLPFYSYHKSNTVDDKGTTVATGSAHTLNLFPFYQYTVDRENRGGEVVKTTTHNVNVPLAPGIAYSYVGIGTEHECSISSGCANGCRYIKEARVEGGEPMVFRDVLTGLFENPHPSNRRLKRVFDLCEAIYSDVIAIEPERNSELNMIQTAVVNSLSLLDSGHPPDIFDACIFEGQEKGSSGQRAKIAGAKATAEWLAANNAMRVKVAQLRDERLKLEDRLSDFGAHGSMNAEDEQRGINDLTSALANIYQTLEDIYMSGYTAKVRVSGASRPTGRSKNWAVGKGGGGGGGEKPAPSKPEPDMIHVKVKRITKIDDTRKSPSIGPYTLIYTPDAENEDGFICVDKKGTVCRKTGSGWRRTNTMLGGFGSSSEDVISPKEVKQRFDKFDKERKLAKAALDAEKLARTADKERMKDIDDAYKRARPAGEASPAPPDIKVTAPMCDACKKKHWIGTCKRCGKKHCFSNTCSGTKNDKWVDKTESKGVSWADPPTSIYQGKKEPGPEAVTKHTMMSTDLVNDSIMNVKTGTLISNAFKMKFKDRLYFICCKHQVTTESTLHYKEGRDCWRIPLDKGVKLFTHEDILTIPWEAFNGICPNPKTVYWCMFDDTDPLTYVGRDPTTGKNVVGALASAVYKQGQQRLCYGNSTANGSCGSAIVVARQNLMNIVAIHNGTTASGDAPNYALVLKPVKA
jgi:hypothetical protein